MLPTHHIYLKDGRTYTLSQLEQAGLSYVPCYPDKPAFLFANLRKRGKQVKIGDYRSQSRIAWPLAQWQTRDDRGVQIFTGKTSVRERDGNLHYLTDFDIEKLFIDTYPQAYQKILSIYRDRCELAEPVETLTKSGGTRLSAYTPALSKKKAFTNQDGDMLLEFFSEDGLSRYDNRYTITSGSLLNIPFLSVKAARDIYAIVKEIGIEKKTKHAVTDIVDVDDAKFPINITYNADGISPYYPIKYCAVTAHRKHPETSGKVQYSKDAYGNEKGHCYDCGEWWKKKSSQWKKAHLKITGETNETYVTLAENEQTIREAFAGVMSGDTSDKPRYLVLNCEKGSGKNEIFLASLKTIRKRAFIIAENHRQVDQNVTRGREKYGLRTRGYRGRGHLFDDSPLSIFPVKTRQQSPAFFQRYNVVCLFYDQILKWNSKGLASNAYCQSCPLRNECPYFQQFVGLQEVDLLVISMTDLFFNPELWSVLRRLILTDVSETMEEEIIGAAFGLETDIETSLDLGVVDEATAIKLYQEFQYQMSVFDQLAHAWRDEPLGIFMQNMKHALESDDPQEEVLKVMTSLDSDTEKLISRQMAQVPIDIDVYSHTLRDKDTNQILSEYYAKPTGASEDDYEHEWRIPVSSEAERILRQKRVSTIPYQSQLPTAKIGVSPYVELRKGTIRLSDIAGRIWQREWTLLDQLKKSIRIEVKKIGIKYSPKGEAINCDIVTIITPPQINPYINNLIFMAGDLNVENLMNTFEKPNEIKWKVREGKRAEYAKGVETFQLLDARLTYSSVFEFEKDVETGKTTYDAETDSRKVVDIRSSGIELLSHLCTLAEQHIADGNLKPVFISWYEFTIAPITDTEISKRMHACMEIGHFDNTRGLNFEDVKVFIKFGYPKAHPDVIRRKAEILHHYDPEPIDDTYEPIDEVGDGYEAIGLRRYRDPRMEAQRQREIRNKAGQTVYRSRPTRWEDTITLDFCDEPIDGWTQRATGFILTDFLRAERFEDVDAMIAEREALTAENTIQDFQRVYQCTERHARRLWEEIGGQEAEANNESELIERILDMKNRLKMSNRAIARTLEISVYKVGEVLNKR